MRLTGGTTLRGRVELCVGRVWGTICGDRWDNNDASVACYQLGFSRRSKCFSKNNYSNDEIVVFIILLIGKQ